MLLIITLKAVHLSKIHLTQSPKTPSITKNYNLLHRIAKACFLLFQASSALRKSSNFVIVFNLVLLYFYTEHVRFFMTNVNILVCSCQLWSQVLNSDGKRQIHIFTYLFIMTMVHPLSVAST